jgi:hypothetical protein
MCYYRIQSEAIRLKKLLNQEMIAMAFIFSDKQENIEIKER